MSKSIQNLLENNLVNRYEAFFLRGFNAYRKKKANIDEEIIAEVKILHKISGLLPFSEEALGTGSGFGSNLGRKNEFFLQ